MAVGACTGEVVFLQVFGFPQPCDFSEAPELPDDVQVRLSVVEMRCHARRHAAQREALVALSLLLFRRRRGRGRAGRPRFNATRWSLSHNRIKMVWTLESMLAWSDGATTKELKTTEPKAKKAKMANT